MRKSLKNIFLSIFVFSLFSGLFACSAKEPWMEKDPAKALQNFVIHAERQNNDVVWEFLSQKDREALEALAKEGKQEAKELLVFGNAFALTREFKRYETIEKESDTATVGIKKQDGTQLDVKMTRERERWTVDLGIAKTLQILE